MASISTVTAQCPQRGPSERRSSRQGHGCRFRSLRARQNSSTCVCLSPPCDQTDASSSSSSTRLCGSCSLQPRTKVVRAYAGRSRKHALYQRFKPPLDRRADGVRERPARNVRGAASFLLNGPLSTCRAHSAWPRRLPQGKPRRTQSGRDWAPPARRTSWRPVEESCARRPS